MILGMNNSKFKCDHCDGEIIEYFNEKYDGQRGKCLHCGIDFPLE